MTENPSNLKSDLRSRLLEDRTSLNESRRRRLDRQICAHLLRLLGERDSMDLAAFLAFRGEPDLMPALEALHHAGRRIWLPVVDGDAMMFRRWTPGAAMQSNRYGIDEPVDGNVCPPDKLEVVLMPLVAYSPTGIRLGMGAGYYDRTFAFCRHRPEGGPLLAGVAYALQEVDSLPAESWDVPLGAVITERGLRQFGGET